MIKSNADALDLLYKLGVVIDPNHHRDVDAFPATLRSLRAIDTIFSFLGETEAHEILMRCSKKTKAYHLLKTRK